MNQQQVIRVRFNGDLVQEAPILSETTRLTIRSPRQKGKLVITFAVPVIDMQCYWVPQIRAPYPKILWTITSESAAQKNFPFISFFNTNGTNSATIYHTNLLDDSQILAQMNQETCCESITITIAVTPDTPDFTLVSDRSRQDWKAILAQFRDMTIPRDLAFPEAAWLPVYCTWYAVHASVTQEWSEANAPIAAQLGFKTWIVDDGWCFDDMKRVSPQTIGDWYENISTWEVSKAKFPDFKGHVKRLQNLGLSYMVWVAPFLIGKKTPFYRDNAYALRPNLVEGYRLLDTSCQKEAAAISRKISDLMGLYDLDGLKIDFLDMFPPSLDTPTGRENYAFIKDMVEQIRKAKPDALIEFRQQYNTPAMLPFATQFRAGDVPFDFVDNFQRIVQIRLSVGDRVPVHADPAYWNPDELSANISRHLIAAIAGVPMLSMDLEHLSDREKAIIKFWLSYYMEHLDTFKNGTWTAGQGMGCYPYLTCKTDKEAIVFLLDPAYLPKALDGMADGGRSVAILNLSSDSIAHPFSKVWNETGSTITPSTLPSGCGALL